MPLVLIALAAFGAWYFGFFTKTTYRAEVGYYRGLQHEWYVGADKTREECQSEAISRFRALNAESPGRAFSWACRKMEGETFVSRVR